MLTTNIMNIFSNIHSYLANAYYLNYIIFFHNLNTNLVRVSGYNFCVYYFFLQFLVTIVFLLLLYTILQFKKKIIFLTSDSLRLNIEI